MGAKNKLAQSFLKNTSNIIPKWGARLLSSSESIVEHASTKDFSNPGLASRTLREKLIERIKNRGVTDELVLDAMRLVERHQFVDSGLASRSYEDVALPIGFEQTISQPFVVARTISIVRKILSNSRSDDQLKQLRVLEIGCGSGYQAAVLCECFGHVTSLERILPLYEKALENCDFYLKQDRLKIYFTDGKYGFPEGGLYDAIFFSASLEEFPCELITQIEEGGVILAPTGKNKQHLLAGVKDLSYPNGLSMLRYDVVSYVPVLEGLKR